MTIGDRIKQCRQEKGLTLLEVAEYLGVKEATVQRYESGNIKTIKYETIGKLANLFEVSPAKLLGIESKKPVSDADELESENLMLFNSLPLDKKNQAIEFLRFLQGK